jgi:DinB superfamily
MMRRISLGFTALAVLAPLAVTAQMDGMEGHMEGDLPTWHQEQADDINAVGDKFLQLADAFSVEQYDWRPMEGVRSVKDVMVLMIAEFYVFPTLWHVDVPEGVPGGFGEVIGKYADASKADIIADLKAASEHMMASLKGLEHDDFMSEADWFGRKVTVTTAIGLAAGDMHEHLGQAIAYARTNHVVPPWSN